MSKIIIIPLTSTNPHSSAPYQYPEYVAIPLTDAIKNRIRELSKVCTDFKLCDCRDHLFTMHEKYIAARSLPRNAKNCFARGDSFYVTTQKWFDKVKEGYERCYIEFMTLVVNTDNDFRITGHRKYSNNDEIKSLMISLNDI